MERDGKRVYSASRLNVIAKCLQEYRHKYRLKERGGGSDPMRLGSALHEVLEDTINSVVEAQHVGPLKVDGLLELYAEKYKGQWRDESTSHYTFEQGEQMIKDWVDRTGAVSWKRYLHTEHGFVIDIGDGVLLGGYIDVIEQEDDGSIMVVDYKSGRYIEDQAALDEHLQLSIYIMAVREMYPDAPKVTGCLDMLRHGVRQCTERTDEQLESVKRYIKMLVKRAENAEASNEFPATVNRLCGWCPFTGTCGAYDDAVNGPMPEIAGDDWGSIAAQRQYLALKAKLVGDELKALDARIKERIRSDSEPLTINLGAFSVRYDLIKTTRKKYPVDETLGTLTRLAGGTPSEWMLKVCTIDKKALTSALKSELSTPQRLIAQATLDGLAKKTHSTRFQAKEVSNND